jgi:hypothetical protein
LLRVGWHLLYSSTKFQYIRQPCNGVEVVHNTHESKSLTWQIVHHTRQLDDTGIDRRVAHSFQAGRHLTVLTRFRTLTLCAALCAQSLQRVYTSSFCTCASSTTMRSAPAATASSATTHASARAPLVQRSKHDASGTSQATCQSRRGPITRQSPIIRQKFTTWSTTVDYNNEH